MKIIALYAENVKRISVVEIRPDGNLVQITGKNGSGKSSILDSIMWALEGAASIQSLPIRKGETSATIRLDLGEMVVTRRFTESGSTLTVENRDGLRYKKPQDVLDKLLGTIAFDPLAFARQKPKEQFETLRSLVKVGVDFEQIDRENAADTAARAALNRDHKQARAQLMRFSPFTNELPTTPIDTGKLVDEIASVGKRNGSIEREQEKREASFKKIQQAREQAAKNRRTAENLLADAATIEADADKDEAALKSLAPLPKMVHPGDIREKLDEANKVNAELSLFRQFEQIRTDAERFEKEADALTSRMAAREKAKREAIAAAKMPVEGIGFGDGAVLLNGVPFDQGSDAEQLRASCAIAMAMNPKLRVLRIRDGSLLDENGLRLLAEMADANDTQIWLERVTEGSTVGIVLEDGHVRETPQLTDTNPEASHAVA